jgi:hypothetical protein
MKRNMQLIAVFLFCFILGTSIQLLAQINTFPNGDLENAEMPAYWTKANDGEAVVEWTSEIFRSPQRALKISDADGSDEPMWMTDVNMAKLNWNGVNGITENVEMEIGGWVKTENVNVNPADAASEIQLVWTFWDAAGAMIFGQPVVMKVPQDAVSTDWVEIKNEFPIVLPVPADSMALTFQFGANATGTAYLDDVFMRNAPGAEGWLGGLFNANFGVTDGWFFWKEKMGSGEKDFGVVSITDEAAHTGNYSLLVSDDDTNPAEVVAISDRNPIQGNELYTVQAWVKTEGINVLTEEDVERSIYFTVTYHTDDAGWAEVSGQDFFVIDQSVESKDWSLYSFTLTAPENATRMSIRARMQHQATGKVYWDDFAVFEGNETKVEEGVTVIPVHYEMSQNYPNPFNPTTAINFSLPNTDHVELAIFNLLGEKVSTLIDSKKAAGSHQVVWNGIDDNGMMLSSGNYFYILSTSKAKLVRKMTLLK